MNITVYCGANPGRQAEYTQAAQALGQWLGQNGHTLVYGGNAYGLMGLLASSAIAAGAQVIGVLPDVLAGIEQAHPGLHEKIQVKTMAERKTQMLALGEAYIALPGGLGTLEEITEALSLMRIGTNPNPCIFYNVKAYYQLLEAFITQMVTEEFLLARDRDKILFTDSLAEMSDHIANYRNQPGSLPAN